MGPRPLPYSFPALFSPVKRLAPAASAASTLPRMGEYFPPTGGMAPWHSRPARLPLPDMTSAPIADTSPATAEPDPERQAKLSGYQRFPIASHITRRSILHLPPN